MNAHMNFEKSCWGHLTLSQLWRMAGTIQYCPANGEAGTDIIFPHYKWRLRLCFFSTVYSASRRLALSHDCGQAKPKREISLMAEGIPFRRICFHLQMSSEVTGRLKEVTQDFKTKLPVILELGNPAMRPRHWQKLFKVRQRKSLALRTQ